MFTFQNEINFLRALQIWEKISSLILIITM